MLEAVIKIRWIITQLSPIDIDIMHANSSPLEQMRYNKARD